MVLGPEHVSEAGSRESKGLGDVSSIHKGPPKILDKLLPSPASYLPSSMNAVVLLLWSQSTKLVAPFRLAGTVGQYWTRRAQGLYFSVAS